MKMKRIPRKLLGPAVSLCLSFAVLTLSASAWFAAVRATGDANRLTIDSPPPLYLLDSDTSDIIRLSLSGLSAGEPLRYVFCVSASQPTLSIPTAVIASTQNINLELAYTNNLQVIYSLSRATYNGASPVTGAFAFTSQAGQTYYYTEGADLTKDGAATAGTTDTNVLYQYFSPVQFDREYCFFILTIDWPAEFDAASLQKETDIIYIIAKGGYN